MYAYTDLEVTGSIIVSGSIILDSGSYSGSGANLYDISASSIIGLNLARVSSGSATASLNFGVSGSSSFQINTNTAITGSLFMTGGIVQGTASFALTASSLTSDVVVLPKRFNLTGSTYTITEGLQVYIFDMYNYGTINVNSGSLTLPLSTGSINNDAAFTANFVVNMGVINNEGLFQVN